MLDTITADYKKVISYLADQFGALQLGKASPRLVENINVYVHSYGMDQKISALANVSIFDGQTLKIEPWDKSTVNAIEKWIYDSNTGLVPQNMGEYIMIKLPALTTERRKEITKLVASYGEEAKISIRNIRHDILKSLKAQEEAKAISETELDLQTKQIDKLTKEHNEKIDVMVKEKSEEVMKI